MAESVVQLPARIVVGSADKTKIRVLHVDDETSFLKIAKQCLEMEGLFQVDVASSVDESFQKLKTTTYDAVVSDYQMPGRSGLEFLKELRANGNGIPFIMFTGKGREEVAIQALNLGANQYVNKTGNPETVYCELAHGIQQAVLRNKAEEGIRISEQKYRNLFEQAPDLMMTLDMKGVITACNTAGLAISRYSRDEIVGKHFSKLGFLRIEDIPKYLTLFASIATGKVPKPVQVAWHSKDGTQFVSEFHVSLIKERDKTVGIQVIARDITERKKAEEAVIESEERLRSVFEAAVDGLAYVDTSGKVVEVNNRLMEIMGYGVNETVGRNIAELGDIDQEDLPKVLKAMEEVIATGKPVKDFEATLIRKNGGKIRTEISTGIARREGKVVGITATVRDITERKKVDDDRSKLLHDLDKRAKELRLLYGISRLVEESDSIDELMQRTVGLLPDAWQYSNIACARIVVGNQEFKTTNFGESNWRQKANIKIGREEKGFVEVLYLEERPTAAEGPFLKEERDLINAVAERLGRVIERVRAEKMPEENQDKFEGLFRANPEATVYLGPDFCVKDINPRFRELFGYSLEEVKGKNINDIVVPNDKMGEAQVLDDQAVKGYAYHDTLRKKKDGSLVHVSISAGPVTLKGQLLGYVGMYKNISDLKKTQEELEESKKHFQSLFNLMADPVAIVDGKGKVLDTTSRVQEITGFNKEEIVGKNFLKLKIFSPRTKAVMIKNLAKRMVGIPVSPYEVEIITRDGRKLPFEINATKIEFKRLPADLVVFHDLSERKKMEEKLRIVGSLTRHDIRNKLTTITGNIYLNKNRLADRPDILESFNDMQLACDQIVRIFEFARDYERLGTEGLSFIDLVAIVDKAASSFPDLKGARVVNECHGLAVFADSLLERLFYNLIDNSLKYGEKFTQVRIHYEESEDSLKLVYEDDGVGISKEVKAKLFNEGFTTGKGSGYGLYLIKRMMDAYGWTIQETGIHGKGAKFMIDIPRIRLDGGQGYKFS